jgi:hypothetical protein
MMALISMAALHLVMALVGFWLLIRIAAKVGALS